MLAVGLVDSVGVVCVAVSRVPGGCPVGGRLNSGKTGRVAELLDMVALVSVFCYGNLFFVNRDRKSGKAAGVSRFQLSREGFKLKLQMLARWHTCFGNVGRLEVRLLEERDNGFWALVDLGNERMEVGGPPLTTSTCNLHFSSEEYVPPVSIVQRVNTQAQQ